jgi:hypothetical protein
MKSSKKQSVIYAFLGLIVLGLIAFWVYTKNKALSITTALTGSTSTPSTAVGELKSANILLDSLNTKFVRTVGKPLKKIRTIVTPANSPLTVPEGKYMVEVRLKSGESGSIVYDSETILLNATNLKWSVSATPNILTNSVNPTGEILAKANENSELEVLVTEIR